MTRIAVIDIGKTNAKLALVEGETLAEIAVVTRPNRVLPGPPWPHFDLEGHWQFFLHHLSAFHAAHGVDAISVTTHGAAAVLLDGAGELAAPMLDYEFHGPDETAAEYDLLRPDFSQTGSPRLPQGLNLGAQLHWQLSREPGLADRVAHVLTYPQYWGWRLTGERATEMTSLGCHTDLWNPWERRFSALAERLGLGDLLAPPRRSNEVLGQLRPELAAATGLRHDTMVAVGIHDSNASLYPYLRGRDGPLSVVSTGTWIVAMSLGGDAEALDPTRDVLVNVDAFGAPVPSARFMGGREFQLLGGDGTVRPDATARDEVLRAGLMLGPAVIQDSGPFRGRHMAWTEEPASEAARLLAVSWYLALVTRTCLSLTGARGPAIIEGPFARNADFCAMLGSAHPEGVYLASSVTGTSAGAALLCLAEAPRMATRFVPPDPELAAYAMSWQQNFG
ncbi:FGGY-family carbohydrate kinase [Paracoccus ravus]|uniref:FGGY-family carbohydrate kinase n=1 Tax=Paracoccus ravus TaxID=2447760 RepID=UPI00106EAB2E|nr:FGGY-family carbohydrate kinase [Paracoccus ravus]